MADPVGEPPASAAPRDPLVRGPQALAAGLSLVAVAVFALWASSDLDQGRLGAMGPGMLPRAVAVLVGVVGVALAVTGLVKDGHGLERWHLRGPLFVFLGIVAFALTVRSVGLIVAGPLVAIISGAASAETRLRELIIFAVVMTALCIGLFKFALKLPIPVLIIPGVIYI